MIDVFLALSAIVFGLVAWIVWRSLSSSTRSKVKLPPGPSPLPIIGNLHQIRGRFFLTMDRYSKEYNKIFYFRLGQRRLVVISSMEHLKSALSVETFNGRLQSDFINYFVRNSGVLFVEGEKWKTHRRLSLHILRDFGFGKSLSEEAVRHEATALAEYLDACSARGKPMDTSHIFSSSTMNIISSIVFGERPGYDDKEFINLLEIVHFMAHESNMLTLLPIIFPSLNIFSGILRMMPTSKKVTVAHDFILKKLAEHQEHMREHEIVEPRDFVEAYYIAQKQYAEKFGPELAKREFSDWQIVRTVLELYLAGMETTATTMCWTTLLLSLHDSVRQRMAEEIHNVIGRDKIVCMEDRKRFQYSLAVIDEILRWTSLAPNGLMHRALTAGKIGEFDIEKDTLIIPNLYSLHHDADLWEKPHEFYPEHFLEADGCTYRTREHFLPFGIGKRVCLGESLARIEVFIFIITLVQRYSFTSHFDKESCEEALIGTDGPVRAPGSHMITFTKLP